MFYRPRFDVGEYQTFMAAPKTIIFVFPKSSVWAMMTALPVSAAQSTIRCDIFSKDGSSISHADEETLKQFFASRVQDLEQEYNAVKFIRFEGTPVQLPILKAHLRRERLAGREIFPGKREGGNSESFCRAEKRRF